jgi:amino acid adenylation domain-containing protein
MLPVQPPEWNRTEADYPRSSTIAEQFARQAALTPDQIAVIYQDRQLTYREVDDRSNRLAHHLQSLGVKLETLVGIFMRRSENIVISLLAVLKASGAYVPLDPSHPKERLSLIIEDSRIPVVLASSETHAALPFGLDHLTVLDVDDPAIAHCSPHTVSSTANSSNLAYVIYTSGSTGRPKGVMVEHRNVVNFFTGMDCAIGHGPAVWLAVTSVGFDISVLELIWTLTRGLKVVIHDDEGTASIADEIARHGVTHLQMTPSLARMLTLDVRALSALGSLKQILLGGEAVPASLIHHIRQVFDGDIYNMYGPTETTIWSTTYHVQDVGITIPIGRPIANTQIYLLDAELKPVRVGEPGELYIAGDGVARGYWNQPELTAKRFLAEPSISPRRIYNTGDLARYLPDGNIEFLGRVDDQVKLRGHRIEPGEIEAALEQCHGVRQAVVIAGEDKHHHVRLVAYVVTEPAGSASKEELKTTLASKLPEIMIPSIFVFLSALPLSQNGKIDRKALLRLSPPDPFLTSGLTPTQPENEVERIVAQALNEALGIVHVGLDDNFFDLGAHSLTIAEMQAKLQNALGREIPLVDFFQFSTVSSLSRHLSGSESADTAIQVSNRARRRRLARQQ